MTTTETVRSETILQEVRARVLALVKNPPGDDVDVDVWKAEVEALGQLEVIYRQSAPTSHPFLKNP